MDFSQFCQHLPTPEAGVALLEHLRWGGVPCCPYCNSDNVTGEQVGFRHHCNDCNTWFSVKVGTFLRESRLDIRKWLYAVWLFSRSNGSLRTNELARKLAVSKGTAGYVRARIQTGLETKDILLSAMARHMELAMSDSTTTIHPAPVRHRQSPRRTILPRGVSVQAAELAGRRLPFVALQDGRMVIQRAVLMEVIGRHPSGALGRIRADGLIVPAVVSAQNLRPFLTDLRLRDTQPIRFLFNKVTQIGFLPEALEAVCRVYRDAAAAGRLWKSQRNIAAQCIALLDGIERGGLTGLFSGPGFRPDGMRRAVIRSLTRWRDPDLASWVGILPDEFFRELFRLQGWTYDEERTDRPALAARLIDDVIFRRLPQSTMNEIAGGVAAGLKYVGEERSVDNIEHPRLREHVGIVLSLMNSAHSWTSFRSRLQRRLPRLASKSV